MILPGSRTLWEEGVTPGREVAALCVRLHASLLKSAVERGGA